MTTPKREKTRLLILGGTHEARSLADAVVEGLGDRVDVTSSLAGRTARPVLPAGSVRRGGFGGVAGMTRHLRAAAVDMVIDATHPFAATISAHARLACRAAKVPRLILDRAAWRRQTGDHWHLAADAADAAHIAGRLGKSIFLTFGGGDLAPFRSLAGTRFLMRRVDPPADPVPLPDCIVILGRGPFPVAGEAALMRDHRIDVVVTKASGGDLGLAKIDAARALGLPVVMIRRPPPEPGPRVDGIEAALAWIARGAGAPIPNRAGARTPRLAIGAA